MLRVESLHILKERSIVAKVESLLASYASSAYAEVHISATEDVEICRAYKLAKELKLVF